MVSESQPEKRLHTLLTKGMLVEAEELAKKFKLDPQPIYEVKAKRILQEMGTINQVSCCLSRDIEKESNHTNLELIQLKSSSFTE